jgi:hypothetical protein
MSGPFCDKILAITGQSIAGDGGTALRRNPDRTPMVDAIFGTETLATARAVKLIDQH